MVDYNIGLGLINQSKDIFPITKTDLNAGKSLERKIFLQLTSVNQ